MGVWDDYFNRMDISGSSLREYAKNKACRRISTKAQNSLSFKTVIINDNEQNVSINSTQSFNVKTVCSMPGETIENGSYILWNGHWWLVTAKDLDNELYDRVKITLCNHLLKWIDTNGEQHEQWCVIEDKYDSSLGIRRRYDNLIEYGDAKISLIIARNEYTVKMDRHTRFLIDDSESKLQMAYRISKPIKPAQTYGTDHEVGVISFILQECQPTDLDNQELGIADYYKYHSRPDDTNVPDDLLQDIKNAIFDLNEEERNALSEQFGDITQSGIDAMSEDTLEQLRIELGLSDSEIDKGGIWI